MKTLAVNIMRPLTVESFIPYSGAWYIVNINSNERNVLEKTFGSDSFVISKEEMLSILPNLNHRILTEVMPYINSMTNDIILPEELEYVAHRNIIEESRSSHEYHNPIFTSEKNTINVFPENITRYIFAAEEDSFEVEITKDEKMAFTDEMQCKKVLTRADVQAVAPELDKRIMKEIRDQFKIHRTVEALNNDDEGYLYLDEMKKDVKKGIYKPSEKLPRGYFNMDDDEAIDEYDECGSPLYDWYMWAYGDHLYDFQTTEEKLEYLDSRFGLEYPESFDTLEINYVIGDSCSKPKNIVSDITSYPQQTDVLEKLFSYDSLEASILDMDKSYNNLPEAEKLSCRYKKNRLNLIAYSAGKNYGLSLTKENVLEFDNIKHDEDKLFELYKQWAWVENINIPEVILWNIDKHLALTLFRLGAESVIGKK